jgi:endonuclease YncB( thermonuclease family)
MFGALLIAGVSVVVVVDGDTLVVADGTIRETIRLAEVDAPERAQPFSQISRKNLVALCRGARVVEVRPVTKCLSLNRVVN